MAKIQSRRSISFAAADFEAAQKLAEHLKIPLAQLAAQALREIAARSPEAVVVVTSSRPIAERVVIDDLVPASPFRVACQLAGCGAVPGQACRPVPMNGGPDPELADAVAHRNRLWQVAVAQQPTVTFTLPPVDPVELQRLIDERVGVLPRPPKLAKRGEWQPDPGKDRLAMALLGDDLAIDHLPARVMRGPHPETWAEISKTPDADPEPFTLDDARSLVAEVSAPGYERPPRDSEDPIDRAIAASSVGAGLRNIEENGLDAEVEDLEQEMDDHPDAGEVRVVYDEEL